MTKLIQNTIKLSQKIISEINDNSLLVTFKGKNQANLDQLIDSSGEVIVTQVNSDINGYMDKVTSVISTVLRNLRFTKLTTNLDNFDVSYIIELLNSKNALVKHTQGLNFQEFGVKNFRIGFQIIGKNVSIGKMVNSIVNQINDNQDTIFLNIPTKWIEAKSINLVGSLVIALYTALYEVKTGVEIVSKSKDSRFKVGIQQILLSIGLVQESVDALNSKKTADGYLEIDKIITTKHFEDVFFPIVNQLNKIYEESSLKDKQIFQQIKVDDTTPTDPKPKFYISVEKKDIDPKTQKFNTDYRRLKMDFKDLLFGKLDKKITIEHFNSDIEKIADSEDKITRLIASKITNLKGVDSRIETAFLVQVAHGEKFSTVKKWFADKEDSTEIETVESDTPSQKIKNNIDNQNKTKTQSILNN